MFGRCKSCRGQKTVSRMGGMKDKCGECKGLGHVPLVELVKPTPVEPVQAYPDPAVIDNAGVVKAKKGKSKEVVANG